MTIILTIPILVAMDLVRNREVESIGVSTVVRCHLKLDEEMVVTVACDEPIPIQAGTRTKRAIPTMLCFMVFMRKQDLCD